MLKETDTQITKNNNKNDIERSIEGVKENFFFFLENTPDFIYFKDKHHRFTYASNAFAQLTGHENWQALIGKDDFDIFPAAHAEAYFAKEQAVIAEGKELLAIEEPYFNDKKELCWVSSSKRPIYDDAGNITGLFGISRDITKIKALEQELFERAHVDSLTQVASRLSLLEQAACLLSLAKRNKQTLAFFYVDLDHFKPINDQHGHDAGDHVLTTVAQRLKQRLRGSDIIGRIGGDEFAVIAFTDGQEETLANLSAQLMALTEQTILYNGKALSVSCSIGVATFPKDAETIQDLMATADKVMYAKKRRLVARTIANNR